MLPHRVLLPLATALLGLTSACVSLPGGAPDGAPTPGDRTADGTPPARDLWVDDEGLLTVDGELGEASLEAMYAIGAAAESITDGRPAEALLLLEPLQADDDTPAIVLFLQGVAHLHLGELDAARAMLARAVALQPDDEAALTVLARADYEAGDPAAAAGHLERVLALDPTNAQTHASLGLVSIELGRVEEAYELLRLSVELDPACFDGHRGLGLLFASVGELEAAERAYRLAVELEPDSLAVAVGLGHVLRDLGRPEDSLPWYRRVLEAQPSDADAHGNLGAALFEADRPHESRRAFEQSLALMEEGDPRAPWIHLALGRVLEQLGDFEGAIDAYETTLALDPDVGIAHEALGLIALDEGRRDAARAHFESALDLSGLRPGAVAHLALIYDELGLAEDVRRLIDLLAVARDREPQVAFHLARILVRCTDPELQDPSQAIGLLDELAAGELGDAPAVWQLLAEALAGEGKYADAVEAMDRAIASAGPGTPRLTEYRAQREGYAAHAVEP